MTFMKIMLPTNHFIGQFQLLLAVIPSIIDLASYAQNVPLGCNPPCAAGQKCMINTCVLDIKCPPAQKFGHKGPPQNCAPPTDPNRMPPSPLERWFTKEVFNDLFPKANIGWGPHVCWPYSYEAFIMAARYFPRFGGDAPQNGYSPEANYKRDLATFFAHAIQETGENDPSSYSTFKDQFSADSCYYRGGFYNWFEGGPVSSLLENSGLDPADGEQCGENGRYCASSADLQYFFPCSHKKISNGKGAFYKGCYFGRGAIQISYNFNYGLFQRWLHSRNITLNILENPNLVMTHRNPPLSILASLWFYMTPQPPKPAMHDLVMGQWEPGKVNRAAGYKGPSFGVTSLVINNECGGEDRENPGGPGESRRIKAFKWFCRYFGIDPGPERLLSCKQMPQMLDQIGKQNQSWQPDWQSTWKDQPCDCQPAPYGGMLSYYQTSFYPDEFVAKNELNHAECVRSVYDNPRMYSMDPKTSKCLNHPMPAQFGTASSIRSSGDYNSQRQNYPANPWDSVIPQEAGAGNIPDPQKQQQGVPDQNAGANNNLNLNSEASDTNFEQQQQGQQNFPGNGSNTAYVFSGSAPVSVRGNGNFQQQQVNYLNAIHFKPPGRR